MPDEKNIHKYPKTKSTDMTKADRATFGGAKKQTTYDSPALKQGKGTIYNQAKITNGFLAAESHPGHKQKKNTEDNAVKKD